VQRTLLCTCRCDPSNLSFRAFFSFILDKIGSVAGDTAVLVGADIVKILHP
jgi:uncharacterized membrane protein